MPICHMILSPYIWTRLHILLKNTNACVQTNTLYWQKRLSLRIYRYTCIRISLGIAKVHDKIYFVNLICHVKWSMYVTIWNLSNTVQHLRMHYWMGMGTLHTWTCLYVEFCYWLKGKNHIKYESAHLLWQLFPNIHRMTVHWTCLVY